MIGLDCRPRLAPGVKLRVDRIRGGFNLLAPEHVLRLNASAAAILQRCDGTRSLAAIIDELASDFPAERAKLSADVPALVEQLVARRMVEA